MSKITIENKTPLDDFKAIEMVCNVVKDGRTFKNNTQYPYSTTKAFGDRLYTVNAIKSKKTDDFTVI